MCSINDSGNGTRSLNFEEDWMGLTSKNAKKYGKVKKKTYLDKCPEWGSVKSNDAVFIPIMKNSNLCQSVKVQDKTLMLRNTCAFDALLHVTIHIIGMNAEYKHFLQTIDDPFLRLAEKTATRGKISRNKYVERALILKSAALFQKSDTRRFISLDTMCNAAHLAEHTHVSLLSLHRTKVLSKMQIFQ